MSPPRAYAGIRLIRRGFVGGFPLAGLVALSLVTGELLSRSPREITATTATTQGVEVEGKEEEEESRCGPSGNRIFTDVNPSGIETSRTSVAAAETGRLRRRASALLQNKVWDPGG